MTCRGLLVEGLMSAARSEPEAMELTTGRLREDLCNALLAGAAASAAFLVVVWGRRIAAGCEEHRTEKQERQLEELSEFCRHVAPAEEAA